MLQVSIINGKLCLLQLFSTLTGSAGSLQIHCATAASLVKIELVSDTEFLHLLCIWDPIIIQKSLAEPPLASLLSTISRCFHLFDICFPYCRELNDILIAASFFCPTNLFFPSAMAELVWLVVATVLSSVCLTQLGLSFR